MTLRMKLFLFITMLTGINLLFYVISSTASMTEPHITVSDVPVRPVLRRDQRWYIITSIHAPTADVLYTCALPDWTTVIVADRKTPEAAWNNTDHGCVFLSISAQLALGYKITPLLPYNNYGRKNVGYLYALEHGALEIKDFDDDNRASSNDVLHYPGEPIARLDGARVGLRAANPYAFYGMPDIWPRGYPIKDVNRSRIPPIVGCPNNAPQEGMEHPIMQGIVDKDPDVDALYRMLYGQTVGKITFRKDLPPVAIARGSYVPTNTQNTVSRYKAFWGLIVPVTTTMRVCDIYRGYWVQRLLWDLGEELLFLPATADQIRNPHDLYKDFLEEQDLFLKIDDLMDLLDAWNPPIQDLYGRMSHLAHLMADKKFWGKRDAELMDAWIEDLTRIGYTPPALRPPPDMGVSDGCAPSPFPPGAKVAMFIRAYGNTKHIKEFWTLIKSLEIFMPLKHYMLIVVLDNETKLDHLFGADVLRRIPTARVHYEKPAQYYSGSGHARQQWSMFWADNYTKGFDLVLILDTDVLFNTPITPGVLFDEQWRPRVKALIDRRTGMGMFWTRIPANTRQWMGGVPEVMRAMSFFPVVMRTQDFAAIRAHIELVNGAPFDDVFQQLACPGKFSQFNIFFNILYYTRRDAYAWSFQRFDPGNEVELPGQLSSWSYDHWINYSVPLVSGTLHWPYLHEVLKDRTMEDAVSEGYCTTAHDTEHCTAHDPNTVRDALFQYDGGLWTWDPRALAAQHAYEQEVRDFGYSYSRAQWELVSSPLGVQAP